MNYKELPDNLRLALYDAISEDDYCLARKIEEKYNLFCKISSALGMTDIAVATLDSSMKEREEKEKEYVLDVDVTGLLVYGKKLDGEIGATSFETNVTFPESVVIEVLGQKGIEIVIAPDDMLEEFDQKIREQHLMVVNDLKRLFSGLYFIPVRLSE